MLHRIKNYVIFRHNGEGDPIGTNFAIEIPEGKDAEQFAAQYLKDRGHLSVVTVARSLYSVEREERFARIGINPWECSEIVIGQEKEDANDLIEGAI